MDLTQHSRGPKKSTGTFHPLQSEVQLPTMYMSSPYVYSNQMPVLPAMQNSSYVSDPNLRYRSKPKSGGRELRSEAILTPPMNMYACPAMMPYPAFTYPIGFSYPSPMYAYPYLLPFSCTNVRVVEDESSDSFASSCESGWIRGETISLETPEFRDEEDKFTQKINSKEKQGAKVEDAVAKPSIIKTSLNLPEVGCENPPSESQLPNEDVPEPTVVTDCEPVAPSSRCSMREVQDKEVQVPTEQHYYDTEEKAREEMLKEDDGARGDEPIGWKDISKILSDSSNVEKVDNQSEDYPSAFDLFKYVPTNKNGQTGSETPKSRMKSKSTTPCCSREGTDRKRWNF